LRRKSDILDCRFESSAQSVCSEKRGEYACNNSQKMLELVKYTMNAI